MFCCSPIGFRKIYIKRSHSKLLHTLFSTFSLIQPIYFRCHKNTSQYEMQDWNTWFAFMTTICTTRLLQLFFHYKICLTTRLALDFISTHSLHRITWRIPLSKYILISQFHTISIVYVVLANEWSFSFRILGEIVLNCDEIWQLFWLEKRWWRLDVFFLKSGFRPRFMNGGLCLKDRKKYIWKCFCRVSLI